MKVAIIGGTGVYDIGENAKEHTVSTKYGSVNLEIVQLGSKEVIFLPRHGKSHSIPPHKINYLANIAALKELGVKIILATNLVGSCNPEIEPGSIVVLKDFLDFTKQRPLTFFDGEDGIVMHPTMDSPYCPNLNRIIEEKSSQYGLNYRGEAVYVGIEGPRFETPAEIKMYKILGGDVSGMTGVPESILAKEMCMCYSSVGLISNYCTGLDVKPVDRHEIRRIAKEMRAQVTKMFIDIIKNEQLDQERCQCGVPLPII